MVKVVEPDKIPITSTNQLALEFSTLQLAFDKDETEHTWEQIDKALKRFHAVVRGGGCKFIDEFVKNFKSKDIVIGMVRSMATERTRLSATTLDLLASITRLGPSFSPLLPVYLPPLLKLLCRTNKLYIARAQSTLSSILTHTHLIDIIKYIVSEWKAESGKSTSFRIGVAELLLAILTLVKNGEIEKEVMDKRIVELEWIIRIGATDREAKVRGEIKKSWEIYKVQWSERVTAFTGPMTPVIKRYLNISGTTSTTTAASQPIRSAPIESRSTAPNLHRTVVTSTIAPSAVTSKQRDTNSVKSTTTTTTTSKPTAREPTSKVTSSRETVTSSTTVSESSKPIKSNSTSSSSEVKTSSKVSNPIHSSLKSNHAPLVPIITARTSRPVVSSSRGAFKPSTTLSRSLGPSSTSSTSTNHSQPMEPKKARRFVPPTLPISNSIDSDLHSSLSRSTSALPSTTSHSSLSSSINKKPISVPSTSTSNSTTPFRPQTSSSLNKSAAITSNKPPMAGRTISTNSVSNNNIIASAQRNTVPLLSRSVSTNLLSRSTTTATIQEGVEVQPLSIVVVEEVKEIIMKRPEEVPLPIDEDEITIEEDEEEVEVSPSFDARLDELVKQTTEPSNDEIEDSINIQMIEKSLKESVGRLEVGEEGVEGEGMVGILGEMLLMEEENPNTTTSSGGDTLPLKKEVVVEASVQVVEGVILPQEEAEEDAEDIVEEIIVEEEIVEEEAVEEVEEQPLVNEVETEVEDESEVSNDEGSTLILSQSMSSPSPFLPQSIPLPLSPSPSPSTFLLTSTPAPCSRTLSSTSSPLPFCVPDLTPSAYHTTSFLFDTPVKSNSLPIVKFPKPFSINILQESISYSIASSPSSDHCMKLGGVEDEVFEDEDQEEIELEEEESISASQSFCVPLNDISQFGDEEFSDTSSGTLESHSSKVFFGEPVKEEEFEKSVGKVGELDETVLVSKSLSLVTSRNRSRSRGRIGRD